MALKKLFTTSLFYILSALIFFIAGCINERVQFETPEDFRNFFTPKEKKVLLLSGNTLTVENAIKTAVANNPTIRAAAQSVHMIRANIEAEINPMVGTEEQSEDMVRYLLKEFEEDPTSIWRSNMFGKSLYELINEGLHNKLEHMPEESRQKLSETLERIINEGSNGLICILL